VNGNSKRVDGVTTWLLGTLTRFLYLINGPSDGVTYWAPTAGIYRLVSTIATVLSSLFLVIGIIILYFVPTNAARLGVVAALTAALSLSLAILTPDRRTENFAATAAFAAVQVVSVGTSGNGTSSG